MKKTLLTTLMVLALTGCGGGEETKTSGSSGSSTPITTTVSVNKSILDVKEGDAQAQTEKITFIATRKAEKPIEVSFKTSDNTAVAGRDYQAMDSKVTIPQGATSAEITITAIGNTIHQGDRDFNLTIVDLKSDAGTMAKGLDVVTIRIKDDDPEPVVQFLSNKLTTHEDIGEVLVPITLDRQSEKEIVSRFTLSGVATKDSDFTISGLEYKIPPMATSFNIPIKILKDKLVEGTEPIELTFSLLTNGKIGERKAAFIFISGDLRLPDTAVTSYFNSGNLHSSGPDGSHPYQDAEYGLDTNPAYNGNGQAGFVYTKIDNAGNPLTSTATAHTCTYDNHTGLTWEIKDPTPARDYKDEKGKDRRWVSNYSQKSKYLWLNRDGKVNGGSAGGINAKEFTDQEDPVSPNCSFPSSKTALWEPTVMTTGCVSEQYVALLNKVGMCGFKDWRLPSVTELTTIASYQADELIHDGNYITDAVTHIKGNPATIRYLSSTPAVDNEASVWCLDVQSKQIMMCNKQTYNHLRLVRGPKL
jgi:hypothetical protein